MARSLFLGSLFGVVDEYLASRLCLVEQVVDAGHVGGRQDPSGAESGVGNGDGGHWRRATFSGEFAAHPLRQRVGCGHVDAGTDSARPGALVRAAQTWPESEAVATGHQGHIIVSLLGKSEMPLAAARLTTAVIGALIATVPECCGVVWAGRVARPADLWLEASRWSLAPYPDYPFRLWVDILPFRSGAKVGVITMGLAAFVGREIEFVTGKLALPALFEKVAGLSVYLIEHGNVVKDGDTIGASASERIAVRYKNSDIFEGLPVFHCTDEFEH